jgi:ketosteroid isomerase-like protein
MSQESVAVVRAMYDAFLRGDVATAEAAFDPEVEWDGTNLPDGKISRGIDAVRDQISRWREIWETWEVELEDVIDGGDDRAIAFFREHGRTKAGIEVNERHSDLYRVSNGRVTYRKGFSDADQALVEAGLR